MLAGTCCLSYSQHSPSGRIPALVLREGGLLQLQVRELLHKRIRDMYLHPQFNTDVMKPLRMEMLLDQEVKNLSGGELQRVAITLALGMPADVYLIDEPSAYLDSEQRIVAAKVCRRHAEVPEVHSLSSTCCRFHVESSD